MLDSVFEKTVWDGRRSIWWWLGGLVVLQGFMVAYYPALGDMSEFADLLEQYPEAMLALFGIDPQEFLTAAGFIHGELYSAMLPVIFLIYTIMRGAAATAGEEHDGTMDLTLSTPVTRSRVVVDSALAMTATTVALGLSLIVVLLVGNLLVDLELSVAGIVAINLGLVLTGLLFGAMALALGAWTGRKVVAAGVATGVAVAAFFFNGLASLIEAFEVPEQFSPFHWLLDSKPLINGFDWGGIALLTAVTVAFFAAAVWAFGRRDISV
jgi:ABC-2 type transport system permease protein